MEASTPRPHSLAQYPLHEQKHANHKSQARLLHLMQDTVTNRLRDRHTSLGRYPLPLSQEGRKQHRSAAIRASGEPVKVASPSSFVNSQASSFPQKSIPVFIVSLTRCYQLFLIGEGDR